MNDKPIDMAKVAEWILTLNDRLARFQVRVGLLEHAVAHLALHSDPKAVANLISSLEIVKMDWREQGSPDPVVDLIAVLKTGPNPTGPEGSVLRP